MRSFDHEWLEYPDRPQIVAYVLAHTRVAEFADIFYVTLEVRSKFVLENICADQVEVIKYTNPYGSFSVFFSLWYIVFNLAVECAEEDVSLLV